jgi:hypothetical protein
MLALQFDTYHGTDLIIHMMKIEKKKLQRINNEIRKKKHKKELANEQ